MMCPRKLFFGILSAVVLMPLQVSAGPDLNGAATAPTAAAAAQPAASAVVATQSRELLSESELENLGGSISHEIKNRRKEIQFKLKIRVPAILKPYLVVDTNQGLGTVRISLKNVPVNVLDLENPDMKKLEKKSEYSTVLIAGAEPLDPALVSADPICVRDHGLNRCEVSDGFLDKPLESENYKELQEKAKLAAKEKEEHQRFCKKLETKLLKKVCDSCGADAEKKRLELIEENKDKINECHLTALALSVSGQLEEFLEQKKCDGQLAALKAGKLKSDEMKSLVGGETCSSQLKQEDVNEAYKTSFWKRDIKDAEDFANLKNEYEENKDDKLKGIRMVDFMRGRFSGMKLDQASDPALIQSMMVAQSEYLKEEAAFCGSKDTEFTASDKSHCNYVLPNAIKSYEQFAVSYNKEAVNIAKRGDEYQRSIAECHAMGPDAGGCLQQLSQKMSGAAATQPGANGFPIVNSAVTTASANVSALSPNGLPIPAEAQNSSFGVYGTPINTSAYFSPAQTFAPSAQMNGQTAQVNSNSTSRIPDRRS